jgi:hypothetical protein
VQDSESQSRPTTSTMHMGIVPHAAARHATNQHDEHLVVSTTATELGLSLFMLIDTLLGVPVGDVAATR